MHPIRQLARQVPPTAVLLYILLATDRESQSGRTSSELAAAVGRTSRSARHHLGRLTELGLVTSRRVGSGVYYSAQDSPDIVVPTREELPPDETTSGEPAPAGELAPTWRETMSEALLSMSPDAFERLCMRLLRESGFSEVTVTGRSGDGGVDGRGVKRLDGLISFPILFQCKRYTNNVTAGAVRDFRGAMAGRADRGLILTTGGFTGDAEKEATRDGVPPIDLIDGELLMNRLKELGLGVSVRTVEVVEVDKEFFDSI